jgi:hypothetical protein
MTKKTLVSPSRLDFSVDRDFVVVIPGCGRKRPQKSRQALLSPIRYDCVRTRTRISFCLPLVLAPQLAEKRMQRRWDGIAINRVPMVIMTIENQTVAVLRQKLFPSIWLLLKHNDVIDFVAAGLD